LGGALTFYHRSKVNEVGRRIRGGKEKEKDKRGNKRKVLERRE